MNILRSFPLLFFPILLYNALAFFDSWTDEEIARCSKVVGANVHPLTCQLKDPWFEVPMVQMASVPLPNTFGPKPNDTESSDVGTAPEADGTEAPDAAAVPPPDKPPSGSGKLYMAVSAGDLILALSLLLLFAEVLSATGVQSSSIVNHAFSLVVLILGLVEFLTLPAFSTTVFLLITLMACLDVLAGFIVTIAAVRRDLSFVGN